MSLDFHSAFTIHFNYQRLDEIKCSKTVILLLQVTLHFPHHLHSAL